MTSAAARSTGEGSPGRSGGAFQVWKPGFHPPTDGHSTHREDGPEHRPHDICIQHTLTPTNTDQRTDLTRSWAEGTERHREGGTGFQSSSLDQGGSI